MQLFKQRNETHCRKSDQPSINLCCRTNCRLMLELAELSVKDEQSSVNCRAVSM
jgi:hypothetical protein